MKPRPWMPLYVADYLNDTAHLTAAESGAYLHLIMFYWVNGRLPSDENAIARIARLDSRAWKRSRGVLESFFRGGHWTHPRIDAEIAKAIEISKSRSANAKQKHSNSRAKALHQPTHSHSHSLIKDNALENFESFFAAYPKRKSRKDAEKAYRQIRREVSHETIMAGLERAKRTDSRFRDPKFTPFPASWLRAGGYEDSETSGASRPNGIQNIL